MRRAAFCHLVHCVRVRSSSVSVLNGHHFCGIAFFCRIHGLTLPITTAVPVQRTAVRAFHHPNRPMFGPSPSVGTDRKGKRNAKPTQRKDQEQWEPSKKPDIAGGSVVTDEDSNKIPIYRVMGHVLHHLWPAGKPGYRALVVASVTCVVLAKVLKVAVPFWFKTIIDVLTNSTEVGACVTTVTEALHLGVFGLVVAYGISRLLSSFTEEMKSALFAPVGCHASTTIAMELFAKLHSLDLQYHLGRETGVLSKDLDRGSRAFWSLAHALLFMVIPTAFEVVLVCTVMKSCAGTPFILTAFSAVVLYIGWTYVVSNWRAEYRARFNKGDSRVGGLTVDSLLNYETVKYFGRESYEESRLRRETADMNHQLMRLDQSMSLLNFGQHAIFVLAALVSLYLSTCGVLAGSMTVGDLVLVDALLMQLYTPLSFLGMIYRDIQASTQNMQAMIALLDVQNSVKQKANAKALELVSGTIELRDVCFAFKTGGDDRFVLRNLSLAIPGGSTVAFVGPSGSGKSTIFRLIYRFYDPLSGSVLIDGQPLTDLQIPSFREAIGVIPQDTVLFNESLRYNICYGRPDATEEEMIRAAKVACIHDSIMNMSDKYDTVVGERGLKLSGGEKQRIAIARVVLSNPPILLADEATAALDSVTEMHVMQQLRDAGGKRRTLILIAHRLTSIMSADKIFVLDGKGSLSESGTHEELLQRGGLYSELWSKQLHDAHRAEE
ncbi:ABC transporter, putative [Trypanosoma brucei gambiense DAL972]|uniref:ABC transporter, putative n=1 Tax=Trypanosoma brucei gambiense (strain MHOM/CI/86/DAL972) TaxID=679716 RepID=D0AAT9_TRYB9|nr:ABC transporter, putative [Trypanosoma brucei gambiense DAL972]CBH18790.1 ABC transporter, putative [Trypanosoma brucei gambiense DAL972]|eukprot:XP_011781054.1 ABC transporter, putative [Trypanosoma brucei gambiense DAL972]